MAHDPAARREWHEVREGAVALRAETPQTSRRAAEMRSETNALLDAVVGMVTNVLRGHGFAVKAPVEARFRCDENGSTGVRGRGATRRTEPRRHGHGCPDRAVPRSAVEHDRAIATADPLSLRATALAVGRHERGQRQPPPANPHSRRTTCGGKRALLAIACRRMRGAAASPLWVAWRPRLSSRYYRHLASKVDASALSVSKASDACRFRCKSV
jgi:hypothetical protein